MVDNSLERNFEIFAGEYFRAVFHKDDDEGDPYNFTGHTLRAQLRERPDSPDVVATFTLTNGLTSGDVTAVLAAATTAPLKDQTYHYHVFADPADAKTFTVGYGTIRVRTPATRTP